MDLKWIQRASFLAVLVIFAPRPTAAQTAAADSLMRFWLHTYDSTRSGRHWTEDPSLEMKLLAKASPDESFNGIGSPHDPNPFSGGGIPKVNESYIWGMVQSGRALWFGTQANSLCSVIWPLGGAFGRNPKPFRTPSVVCEFNQSRYRAGYGDWRPPRIYLYDLDSHALADRTPDDPLIGETSGFRSAGGLGDIVFLAGPAEGGGITLFAFNATTREFIGSRKYEEYTNIRQWLVSGGVLYTSVKNASGSGSVLRWTGDLADPFRFEAVGLLDNEGAYLETHEGRLFVMTWPLIDRINLNIVLAGLFMSPVLPAGGLRSEHANGWIRVWKPSDYDPDFVTGHTYLGGAMASFDGYLYWGTMHVPFAATVAHLAFNEPRDSVAAFLGSYRPVSVFRGRNFHQGGGEVQLVYGLSRMPKYTPISVLFPKLGGKWEIVPNKMGMDPLYGSAGFCNFYNNYVWTMAVHEGRLFVGTMDWSYLYDDAMPQLMEAFRLNFSVPAFDRIPYHMGADLFRFENSGSPARPENLHGMGNPSSYGVRTMVSGDGFYLGMANSMNLLTDPGDEKPEGGWELIRLGRTDFVSDGPVAGPEFALSQGFPNPFNSGTSVEISLPRTSRITLVVCNVKGQIVRTLMSHEELAPGTHRIAWDGRAESGAGTETGIYFLRMNADGACFTKKALQLK